MRLVGLTGKAGSGKSFIASNVLVPEGYIPLALAGPMKAELAGQGVIPGDEALGFKPKSPRTRSVLQIYGTELGRERFHEDVWCSTLEWWIGWFTEHDMDRFVITDVRFPNELRWLEMLGGVAIRVTGRGGLEGEAGEHISETALDEIPVDEVDNSEGRNWLALKGDVLSIVEEHYAAGEPGLDEEVDIEFAASYDKLLKETLESG